MPQFNTLQALKGHPLPLSPATSPWGRVFGSQLLESHRGGRFKAGPPPPQGSDSLTMAQCQPHHPHGRAALCQQTQKQGGDGDVPRLSVTSVIR